MKKNGSFLISLKNACCGIKTAFINEINFRIHISVADLIIVFAYFYGLSRVEWAVLILMTAMVISAELFNTAVEKAVDTATDEWNEKAKISKDTASGGVLVLAVFALLIGCFLFLDIQRIADTLKFIFTSAKILIPCLILGIFDIFIIILPLKKSGRKKINE